MSYIALDKVHMLHEIAAFFIQEWIYSNDLQNRAVPPCVLTYDYYDSDNNDDDDSNNNNDDNSDSDQTETEKERIMVAKI